MTQQGILNFAPLKLTTDETRVWGVLKLYKGRDKAINQYDLAKLTGIPNERRVRAIIKDLVEVHHKMICSDYRSKDGGYFVPATQEEVDINYRQLKAHALSILKRASVFRKFDLVAIQQELPF